MTSIEFNIDRVKQFAERTNQTVGQATAQIMSTFGTDCNQQAVNDLIDPVVDEIFKTHNRPKP